MERPLRLMIYDRTCTGPRFGPGLSHAWWAGAHLYRALGRFDAWIGARSWAQALHWLARVGPNRAIAEVQYWGHGKWGHVRLGDEILDLEALRGDHPLRSPLDRVRERLSDDATVWFRCCETFGAERGRAFASAFAEHMGCRTAGHTFVIAHWQSGLHVLAPGKEPHWSPEEGLAAGTPAQPERAHGSRAWHPNTVTFLHGRVPDGY